MPVEAVKDFGGTMVQKTFGDESWKSGVPQKNGWKQMDHNTAVLAAKLPEAIEVKNRKVETVEVPEMPLVVTADEENTADQITEAPVVAETKKPEPKPAAKPNSKNKANA